MRIFFAAAASPNYWSLPGSRLWHVNLRAPLVDLGHEVIHFQYDYGPHNNHLDASDPIQKAFIDAHRPRLGEELLRQLRAALRLGPIDLFFSYFYSAYVEPDVIRAISRMGIPTVNWYCNGSYQFNLVSEIAPAYDFCLVPEKFRLEDYRKAGANPIYCQEAANPNVYKPVDVPVEFDVTFVGQRYGNRPNYIKALLQAGTDVHVWGPRWNEPVANSSSAADADLLSRAGAALEDDELVRMYSRSRISLGFSAVARLPRDGSPPIKQVRLRDFEAPMSGAFYLAEYFDELTDFFEPGKEIACFTDAEDLVEKAQFYLAHESERCRIREAGLRRARLEHTWHQRFQQVFRLMGLNDRPRRRGQSIEESMPVPSPLHVASGPAVTVLMSVFNEQEYLPASAQSILAQSFNDFEFLIVNDGSNDASTQIIQELASKDARIRIIPSEKNEGLTRSLNKGLNEARGRYIARMDADDISEIDRLEQQVTFLECNPEVGIVGTSRRLIDENGDTIATAPALPDDLSIRWKSLLGNPFAHPSVMLRRDILEKHGLRYDESFATAQDYDLWVRLLSVGRGANLPDFLLRYRLRGGISRTRRDEQLANHDRIAAQAFRLLLPDLRLSAGQIRGLRGRFGGLSAREPDMCPDDPQWIALLAMIRTAFQERYGPMCSMSSNQHDPSGFEGRLIPNV